MPLFLLQTQVKSCGRTCIDYPRCRCMPCSPILVIEPAQSRIPFQLLEPIYYPLCPPDLQRNTILAHALCVVEAPELPRAVLAAEFADHAVAAWVGRGPGGAAVDDVVDDDPCSMARQ